MKHANLCIIGILEGEEREKKTKNLSEEVISENAAAKSLQLCPTLCDFMVCSLPGSSVHGTFQARVLEWGAIAFSDLKMTHF